MHGANELKVPPQELLRDFELRHNIPASVDSIGWDVGRTQLINFALDKRGPDVSEMGTTWVSGFTAMNALRPFETYEITRFGGPSAFLPIAWQSGLTPDGRVWSIPWLTDTRIIYYRRDWLAKAGIDEATAFQTFDRLTETLDCLRASGVAVPWVIPTNRETITLHSVAPWVWHTGGTFIRADGHQTRFSEPEALAGISHYFQKQLPYLAPSVFHLTESECNDLFQRGEAAAAISGYWLLGRIRGGQAVPQVADNVGVAVFPGIPFVGGSNLVIWDYSYKPLPALKLVEYLTSYEVQSDYVLRAGQIPARLDVLAGPPFTTDPYFQVIRQSLETGRSFTATYLWGKVEERLSAVINNIWSQLFADPTLNIETTVAAQLKPLAVRLDQILNQA